MPVLDQLTRRVTDRLPSVISPRGHAVADYAMAGGFLAYGVLTWNRNRRAAFGSIGCGLFQLALSAVTDYPGGVVKELSFPSHGRIDIGLVAMVGAMPGYLGIEKAREARFFRMQAAALAGITGLTDFTGSGRARQLSHLEEAA